MRKRIILTFPCYGMLLLIVFVKQFFLQQNTVMALIRSHFRFILIINISSFRIYWLKSILAHFSSSFSLMEVSDDSSCYSIQPLWNFLWMYHNTAATPTNASWKRSISWYYFLVTASNWWHFIIIIIIIIIIIVQYNFFFLIPPNQH